MKKRKLVALMTATALATSLFATGCGAGDSKESKDGEGGLSGTLTFAIWDNNLNNFIESNDMIGKFQEEYPDIEIEVEKIKDDSEYWKTMKMRASADQLPDIMFNKPFTLSRFQDYLLDLSDTEAAKNNELAEGYAIDGKVLGVPMTAGYEYVYYWKDMFKEAGVEVPTTWAEFEEVSKKLQDFYGKDNADFAAISCGLKDEWPDYPYMEFMPALETGNGQIWNDMATMDEPFAEGTDLNKAYNKVNNLFTSGVLGKDPLGIGNDQAVQLFCGKNSAMIALGDWGLQDIRNKTEDTAELGSFYLPTRNTAEDPFNVIVQGDSFMGVTTHSENPEAAKAFVEWFYSDAWYPDYLNYVTSASSMTNFPKEKDAVHAEADEIAKDAQVVLYAGSGDTFTELQNETTFDYKKLGAEMMTEGFDLDAKFAELNEKWAAAREKLELE